MKTRNKVQTAAAALAVVLALSACGSTAAGTTASGSSASSDTADISAGVQPDQNAVKLLPDPIKKKGTISVAMELAYPPTSFLTPSNEPAGFNVDISRLIAAKLGLKLDVHNVQFATIIPGLTGGRYDFTATDMSKTAARLKVLDMIDYWNDGSSLGVKTGNPEKLDINDSSVCGKSIAVMPGTTQQQTYLPLISTKCTDSGKPAVKTAVLPNVNAALSQLASGRIEGIFYDTPSLAYAAKQDGNAFSVAAAQYDKPASLGSPLVAIALQKGSPLTKAVQAAMQSTMGSPQYKQALANWGLESGAITDAKLN